MAISKAFRAEIETAIKLAKWTDEDAAKYKEVLWSKEMSNEDLIKQGELVSEQAHRLSLKIDATIKKVEGLDALFQAAYKEQFRNGFMWGAIATTALLALMYMANADASERADQYQDQSQKQNQAVTVNIGTDGTPLVQEGPTTLSADDNSFTQTTTSNVSNNTVLIPNNNTEGCLRVFGFGFPTGEGSVVLGIPWRSGPCDLEASADDAFAQGNLALGWMFKCKMKALKKAFGTEANCLSQTVEAVDMQGEIERLRSNIETLLNERKIDRLKCEESKDRIFAACNEK